MGIPADEIRAQIVAGIATVRAGAPNGGFPPIVTAGVGDVQVNPAVAGCSYPHYCSGAPCGCLVLPLAPNDGDQIGLWVMCQSSALVVNPNGKLLVRGGTSQPSGCGANVPTTKGTPTVLRFSASRDLWEVVQGDM